MCQQCKALKVSERRYLEVTAQIADRDETLVVNVETAKAFDVDVDLVLGEVDRYVLAVVLEVQAHLQVEEVDRMFILFLITTTIADIR